MMEEPDLRSLKEENQRLREALDVARSYINIVRFTHWPNSIPAANTIHAIDAALQAEGGSTP